MGSNRDERRIRLKKTATILDDLFTLPGTSWRFGLDGVLGLIPGLGDTGTALIGSYIFAEAWRAGARKRVLLKILSNIVLDWAIGLFPVIGDLLDFGFKAHRRNLQLLLDELDYLEAREATADRRK